MAFPLAAIWICTCLSQLSTNLAEHPAGNSLPAHHTGDAPAAAPCSRASASDHTPVPPQRGSPGAQLPPALKLWAVPVLPHRSCAADWVLLLLLVLQAPSSDSRCSPSPRRLSTSAALSCSLRARHSLRCVLRARCSSRCCSPCPVAGSSLAAGFSVAATRCCLTWQLSELPPPFRSLCRSASLVG